MKNKTLSIVSGILLIVPLVYLAEIYPALPNTIPTHFGLSGKPDAFGPKLTLVWTSVLLCGIGLVTCVIFQFLPRLDPKLNAKSRDGNYSKISFVTALIFSGLLTWIIYGTVAGSLHLTKLVGVVVGLGICLFGNFMYNVKPNYFFGIRVPWTLESEANWRATHHLAGRLWFFGGIVISIVCLFFPALFPKETLIIILLALAIVPTTYSFLYYRKNELNRK